MRKMFSIKTMATVFASSVVLSTLSSTATALAQDYDALINDTQYAIDNLSAQQEALKNELTLGYQALEKMRAEASELLKTIASDDDKIKELNGQITELEKLIEKREGLLADQARAVQVNGGTTNYLNLVASSESISDFVGRLDVIRRMVSSNKDLLTTQKEDKEAVETKRAEVETAKKEKVDKQIELEKLKESLEAKQSENEAVYNKLTNDITLAAEQRDALVAEKQAYEEQMRIKAAQEAAAAAQAKAIAEAQAQAQAAKEAAEKAQAEAQAQAQAAKEAAEKAQALETPVPSVTEEVAATPATPAAPTTETAAAESVVPTTEPVENVAQETPAPAVTEAEQSTSEAPATQEETPATEVNNAETAAQAAQEAAKQAEATAQAAQAAAEETARQAQAEAAAQAQAAKEAAEKAEAAQAQATAAQGNVDALLSNASQFLGTPYVWGGKSPSGFDCSGFVQYVYRQTYGKDIGGWTGAQESAGQRIPVNEAQPGDLYFWGEPGGTYHVAIAVGNGRYIHASQPGTPLEYNSISSHFAPTFALRVNK
ncbi:C40 family peptidase [Tuanshanicoccus lijuaniae]|uniref:C40 family peptidase n=1 Tax=Aerococcaceae bacterium zg-1292 TaxID=2774330 RepID=UPI00193678A4|nr:C40 family peptidase [Aerococcaceae bacterium zg-1292]MBS4456922.1 C40 family peptidase [Aerococcaceae bacterium zg-A91]MBS4458861.1 C40 family peptidase [Aerococcaceae bacterium zg-BR33]QQA36976.1 C40 family peptidase [Aerococcaceae bacterium zg-1292]